ncbi:hypothetical protein ANN_08321 [Periplaneta americana]|uniref:Uncharacterized protein n=1 Tax=Periplaneta americana TaxID=6978 RepID=A0ABQ8T1R6_PERAM|nr:hypothetical protein ANN_08321 [Periplaneta americana]
MAGLCEGGNEPAGSLKAIWGREVKGSRRKLPLFKTHISLQWLAEPGHKGSFLSSHTAIVMLRQMDSLFP